MNARIEITIEANDAQIIESKIREIAGQSLNWTWTNAGSPKQIAKHVNEIEREGEYIGEDGGSGWMLGIVVTR